MGVKSNSREMSYPEIDKELRIAQSSLDKVLAAIQAKEPPLAYGNDRAIRDSKPLRGHMVKVTYNQADYLYPSIREAARFNHIDESSIRKNLKRKEFYHTRNRVFSYYKPHTMALP